MSDYDVIFRVSKSLRSDILTALEGIPGLNLTPGGGAERISAGLPKSASGGGVIASLYLYRVDVAPHLRPQPLDPINDRRHSPPPTLLQLRYLFTPLSGDEANNQLMLGRVLQYLGDSPVLSVPEELQGGAESHASECRMMSDTLSTEQFALLWTSFGTPYRAGLPLLVEGIAMERAAA